MSSFSVLTSELRPVFLLVAQMPSSQYFGR